MKGTLVKIICVVWTTANIRAAAVFRPPANIKAAAIIRPPADIRPPAQKKNSL